MMLTIEEAIEITLKLSRQANFPDSEQGIKDLAKGLQKAVALGISPDQLIEACKSASPYCPTDWDMMQVARDLLPHQLRPSYETKEPKCPHCHGTGWAEFFYLVTHESPGNKSSYKRREQISRAIYEGLVDKVDHIQQETYSAVKRCACGAVPAADKGIS